MIGRATSIRDNGSAEGKAKPMVVVMPLGHAIQRFWAGPAKAAVLPPGTAPAGGPGGGPSGALQAFSRELMEGVLPPDEQSSKASKNADDYTGTGRSPGG